MSRNRVLLVPALVALVLVPLLSAAPAQAAPVPKVPDYGRIIDPYPTYTAESTCSPTEKPGAKRVRDVLMQTYGTTWTNITRACTSANSGHEEGRAIDWRRNVKVPAERAQVESFINWLLATDKYGNQHAMARRMGIMYLMWDGRIWGAYSPSNGWRPQSSGNCTSASSNDTTCHRDHLHISLSWEGARAETSFYTGAIRPCTSGASCPVTRLSGGNRYQTSVAIGRAAYPSGTTVVIANGEQTGLVDGLVAGPLARRLQAPVLLSGSTSLPSAVTTEIRRRGARTAILVGGTSALNGTVVQQVRAAGVTDVQRVSGTNRYETAAAVAARVGGSSAVVASGADTNLVDALGAGGAAARLGIPIVLASRDELPAASRTALSGRRSVVIAGGEGAVGRGVAAQLPSPVRVSGTDRYATSLALARHFSGSVSTATVSIASGNNANLVDALPGAALGQPTLLTHPNSLPSASRTFVRSSAVSKAVVLGGPSAVSARVAEDVSAQLGG